MIKTNDNGSKKVSQESLRVGIVGNGITADKFIKEAQFVRGVKIAGIFGQKQAAPPEFVNRYGLANFLEDYQKFLRGVDAVYIASPPFTHFYYSKRALCAGKHVLCEKPLAFTAKEAEELFTFAGKKKLLLLEAMEIAFSPGFIDLIRVAGSGMIGEIKSVEAAFPKPLKSQDHNTLNPKVSGMAGAKNACFCGDHTQESDIYSAGGSVTSQASLPLLAIVKLLGIEPQEVIFFSHYEADGEVDLFTQINLTYQNALAVAKVGPGVKSKGDLVISGTKGYIYVAFPWWKFNEFEIRLEEPSRNTRFSFEFEGDGLRYAVEEFAFRIRNGDFETELLSPAESTAIAGIIEGFSLGQNCRRI